jgi:hypothetical protein
VIRIAEVIVVSSLLCGCGQMAWVPQAGGPLTPMNQAIAICNLEAERSAPTYGSGSPLAVGMQQNKTRELCMKVHGFDLKRVS